jgi:CheY-like chemotaxis protein
MFEQADLNDLHTAPSGPAALDMIKAQKVPFDCMLLDVDMPEMDGIELCRRIRTVPGYEDKPILMLTAKTDSISIEKAFAAGANDYIAKPFNLKDIYNRIRVAERLLVSSKTIKRIDASDLSKEGTQVAEDITLADKVFLANVGRLIRHSPLETTSRSSIGANWTTIRFSACRLMMRNVFSNKRHNRVFFTSLPAWQKP